jgi:outer membrane murein-binding lipoprotein Lpp
MKTRKGSALQFMAAIMVGSALLVGCNKDEPTVGTVALKIDAASSTGNTINGRVAATSVITDIKINIREIEFEFDKEDAHFKADSSYDFNKDVKLKGPFLLDVLEQNAFIEQLITTVNVPNAKYEQVEFKLHKSTAAGVMNGKSILITGTIDGKPFIFWHDTDEEFEIDFADANTDLLINANTAQMVINLQLDRLFSTLKGGISLALAKDGDGDGTIEINPGSVDNDGNKDLAHAIKNLLEHATDLIDDKD